MRIFCAILLLFMGVTLAFGGDTTTITTTTSGTCTMTTTYTGAGVGCIGCRVIFCTTCCTNDGSHCDTYCQPAS